MDRNSKEVAAQARLAAAHLSNAAQVTASGRVGDGSIRPRERIGFRSVQATREPVVRAMEDLFSMLSAHVDATPSRTEWTSRRCNGERFHTLLP
jgi:hypothetical protein